MGHPEYRLSLINHFVIHYFLEKFYTIQNGLRSEYHIATALYDLWDGPDKDLPERAPCIDIHGWNDSESNKSTSRVHYQWKSKDDISFDLKQICAPLQTVKKKADLKNFRNIDHYFHKLYLQD